VTEPWSELRRTLLPPEDGMFHFGGEATKIVGCPAA
jgi:hypothetical protein